MSRMTRKATTNITTRIMPRSTNGTPRLHCAAMNPPATEPTSIATPVTICPRAKTASSSPVKPLAARASTSHASTAPEKNVNPSPIRIETIAHCQKGASTRQSRT